MTAFASISANPGPVPGIPVVANTLIDTMPNNNTQSIDLMPANLVLFANGFELMG